MVAEPQRPVHARLGLACSGLAAVLIHRLARRLARSCRRARRTPTTAVARGLAARSRSQCRSSAVQACASLVVVSAYCEHCLVSASVATRSWRWIEINLPSSQQRDAVATCQVHCQSTPHAVRGGCAQEPRLHSAVATGRTHLGNGEPTAPDLPLACHSFRQQAAGRSSRRRA